MRLKQTENNLRNYKLIDLIELKTFIQFNNRSV